jgi:hypothetical protein
VPPVCPGKSKAKRSQYSRFLPWVFECGAPAPLFMTSAINNHYAIEVSTRTNSGGVSAWSSAARVKSSCKMRTNVPRQIR